MERLLELATNMAVEEVRNIQSLEEKMTYLANELQYLYSREADVRTELEVEESARGKKRKVEVGWWLNSVREKRRECQILGQEVQQSRACELISRRALARRVVQKVQEVTKLVEQSRCFQGLVLDTLEPEKLPLVTSRAHGHAFEHNLRKIMAHVMDDNKPSIGIHGMGGVGKTTLALQVHNNLLRESKFGGCVYWITVSQDFSIYKLQKDIAKDMRIDLSNEEDEKKRAGILQFHLKKKHNFALILDDVWKGFDAEEIGVPLEGRKLLITSREGRVCSEMGCNDVIKVEVLSEIEAWELFQEKLKLSPTSHLELGLEEMQIAQEVAKECAGLPLGIITIAASMRGVTDIHEWRNALEELKESFSKHESMKDKVFPILWYSYNRLGNPILQSCFLYCSLYPEDEIIPKNELVRSFVYEEIMDKRSSRRLEFDQGYAILSKLESACLLACEGGFVKMHDLIRDMALWITKEKKPRFMVKSEMQLGKVPPEEEWAHDLNRVSLMHNRIDIIPDGISPRCRRLSSLYLNENQFLTSVSGSFFMHMKSLQTLDLSDTAIAALPDSVSLLVTLKALLLRNCEKLVSLPSLKNLKALTELDLYNTSIVEVIHGLESLTNLKCLDFQHHEDEDTPPLAWHGLTSLQRLILSENKFLEFEEVKKLRHLEEFQGRFAKMNEFRQFMISMNSRYQLRYYHLSVGENQYLDVDGYLFNESDFAVCITGEKTGEIAIDDEMMLLLRDIEYLAIADAMDMKCLLRVSRQDEEVKNRSPLERLKDLRLIDLPELKNIIEWEGATDTIITPPPTATFSSLTELNVKGCDGMKKLLPRCLVDNLRNLENLYLDGCSRMEIIFGEDNEGEENNMGNTANTITLPKLKILHLYGLPEMKSICKSTIICNSIQEIKIKYCTKLKKIPLSFPLINGQQSHPSTFSSLARLHVEGCDGMKKLLPLCLVNNLRNLEELDVCWCSGMEEITFGEDNEGEENNMGNTANTITLPKLKKLCLWQLPELKSICKSTIICNSIQDISIWDCRKLKKIPLFFPLINGQQSPPSTFSSLTHLQVEGCDGMKKLLPLCLVDNLRNLEVLQVCWCSGMEEIIFGEDNEGEENNMGNTANTITLPKLKQLWLWNMPELKSICKSTIICNSIQDISIWGCRKLKKIPLFFPLINDQQSPPSTLERILIRNSERKWWDSLEWDNPHHNNILQSFLTFHNY